MGNSNVVELHPDQDSPTMPGCQSIISDPLDALDPPVTGQMFIDELLTFMRYPVDDPKLEVILKNVEVKEISADCFTVKVIADGKKLKDWGFGREDGMDRIRRWKKVTVDRAEMMVTTEDFVPEAAMGAWADEASDAEVLCTCHIKMLADPVRLECWLFMNGMRITGDEGVVLGLTNWSNNVLNRIKDELTAEVKVKLGPSKKEPGQNSAISDPMDEHVDYDAFFTNLIKVMREMLLGKEEGRVCEDVNEHEFHFTNPKDEVSTKLVVKHSQETGDASIVSLDAGGTVVLQTCLQVHKDPLVVEFWSLDGEGARQVNASFVKKQQRLVNEVIARSRSWFG